MPVSEISNIPFILQEVVRVQPSKIMDLGMGVGKYGVLLREVLEGVHGRVHPDTWQVTIDGYEGFSGYGNPAWDLYNNVVVSDFTYAVLQGEIRGYDLVLAIDVLEHHDKQTAFEILRHLIAHNKRVIVSVPCGLCPQGAVNGNELERHRSTWSGLADFQGLGNVTLLRQNICCVVSIQG